VADRFESKISNADMKSILKFMDKFSVTKGIVVTRNISNTGFFGEKEIIFVPLWVLLLTS
jgi:hypothetical protein